MGGHDPEFGNGQSQFVQVQLAARFGLSGCQDVFHPLLSVIQNLIEALEYDVADSLGQDKAVDDGGTENTQYDFFRPGHCHIENGRNAECRHVGHCRHGDKSDGIPAQQKRIGSRSSVHQ